MFYASLVLAASTCQFRLLNLIKFIKLDIDLIPYFARLNTFNLLFSPSIGPVVSWVLAKLAIGANLVTILLIILEMAL